MKVSLDFRRPGAAWFCLLLLLAFVAVWFFPNGVALGAPHTDLVGQFIAWRSFAADSLRAGDLPLWNPYTYAGQPFLGGFQSALLYPPNLVFVLLPLERALNFSVLLHLLILGAGMAHWARQRGLCGGAAVIAGFSVALSGAVFPHVYAGHLSNLCTMAWAPWTFAGLEAWWRDRRLSGLLWASAALALQILAGQIQYVFFFGVAAGLHALVATIFEPATRRRALLAVALCSAAACALTAAQLLPGLEAAGEGVRQGRLDFRFASTFALPPENLLTALAPGFFGDADRGAHPYWGRGYIWEMSLFCGLLGMVFAAVASRDPVRGRSVRLDLLVVAVLLVLALGRHTPVYRLLYEYVPGFGQFRGVSKFIFPAILFTLLAAATGIDGLLRGRWNAPRVGRGLLGLAAGLGLAAALVRWQPGAVRELFESMHVRGNENLIAAAEFPPGAAEHAASSLVRAAAVCFVAGFGLAFLAGRAWVRWAVIALLPLEMIQFAAGTFATTPTALAMPGGLRDFVRDHPGDYRVLNLVRPNSGYLLGAPDLWGNDPGVLKRYAEFMTATQGGQPDFATQNVTFTTIPRLYAMLRCRYVFLPPETAVNVVDVPDPLPHALLVSDYTVARGRDEIFAALNAPGFDPRRTVILEQEPTPRPHRAADPGTVRVVAVGNDTLELAADLTAPALLLITDLYSRGWRVSGGAHQILPANYILRAIPLPAGHHELRLEYRPTSFTTGLVVSTLAWIGWIAGVVFLRRRETPAASP